MSKYYFKFSFFFLFIFVLFFNYQDDFNNVVNGSNSLNTEINKLNQDIKDKKDYTERIDEMQKKYSDAIVQKQSEKASLENQISILDNKVAKTELDIERVETEINRITLEIEKTNLDIKNKNEEIEKEKKHIANVIRLMDEKDKVSSVEIILMNNSLADFLSQVKYLEDVNKTLDESLDNLGNLIENLETEKKNLDVKNEKLVESKKKLEQEKIKLAEEVETKNQLIQSVGDSEREYQRLLERSKREQQEISAEIANMERAMRLKMKELEDSNNKINVRDGAMAWPVAKNVITTYFHDPEYPFRYIFEHPAVDIRAAQGSSVKAAMSGYVARAKDAGMGYSYIMIVHADGLSTVYGHMSKIYVTEDSYVTQGQSIGLSGGMPGTPGAGNLTTGPHLHFEVRLNGIPTDPLGYLN